MHLNTLDGAFLGSTKRSDVVFSHEISLPIVGCIACSTIERDGGKDGGREKERESSRAHERESARTREGECVCVCVCERVCGSPRGASACV